MSDNLAFYNAGESLIAQLHSDPHPVSLPTLSFNKLAEQLRCHFDTLPDFRQGSNRQTYDISDAALSAFSVFFTQSPSFLDHQTRMQQLQGSNNANHLFGVHLIPSSNQIRNLLDPISPTHVFPLLSDISQQLMFGGYLDHYRSINDQLLIALDGTDTFSSEKIHCACCSEQTLKNGKTLYRHIAVTPVIVASGQSHVVPLPPEFVQPQDGHDKQDCEIAASKRWLTAWGKQYAPWRATLLGDDLYCHQPFCLAAQEQGFDFILVCKPDSHSLTYEWLEDFERSGRIKQLKRVTRQGKQRLTEHYRYLNDVPLRNTDDALSVSWCEVTVTDKKGKVVYTNAWATSHHITAQNVTTIVEAGRARWKVENENNNVLKNHGYQLSHNFGHGKQHLSNLLVTLILLAFLMHTALDWLDERYQQIRQKLPSRQTFFEHLRALTQYLLFDDWDHLMAFMLNPAPVRPVARE